MARRGSRSMMMTMSMLSIKATIVSRNSRRQGCLYIPGARKAMGTASSTSLSASRCGNESVFVTEKGNQRVQEFDLDGVYIRQWGGFGAGNGEFNTPSAIDADSLGYLYVTDTGNQRVQKFTPDGAYLLQFGTFGTGNGQFRTPLGIAIDSAVIRRRLRNR